MKKSNNFIYAKITDFRKRDSKLFACASIAILCYELHGRLSDRDKFMSGEKTSQKFKPITNMEILEMKSQILNCVKEKIDRFGITQSDIDNYNRIYGNTINIKIENKSYANGSV